MWWTREDQEKLDRNIVGQNIDRDTTGRQLNPEAREAAITEGVRAWHEKSIGNGEAARIGIQKVTEKTFKQSE